jgi:hypothetical protein
LVLQADNASLAATKAMKLNFPVYSSADQKSSPRQSKHTRQASRNDVPVGHKPHSLENFEQQPSPLS